MKSKILRSGLKKKFDRVGLRRVGFRAAGRALSRFDVRGSAAAKLESFIATVRLRKDIPTTRPSFQRTRTTTRSKGNKSAFAPPVSRALGSRVNQSVKIALLDNGSCSSSCRYELIFTARPAAHRLPARQNNNNNNNEPAAYVYV